jgi:hypothetical protein
MINEKNITIIGLFCCFWALPAAMAHDDIWEYDSAEAIFPLSILLMHSEQEIPSEYNSEVPIQWDLLPLDKGNSISPITNSRKVPQGTCYPSYYKNRIPIQLIIY